MKSGDIRNMIAIELQSEALMFLAAVWTSRLTCSQTSEVNSATDRCLATFCTSVRAICDAVCCHRIREMYSSHGDEAAMRGLDGEKGLRGGLLREAEFGVASAISVREHQKDRLLAMVTALSPSPVKPERSTRQRSTSARRGQATPLPPSLHVIGDVLLLLRAASVNVVERIHAWRQQLHQGKPEPYFHNSRNYLLVMCEDTDFLHKVDVLIEWLGFSLRRNPFITRDGLDPCDARPPSRPEAQGENSNARQPLTRLPTLHTRRVNDATTRSTPDQTRATSLPPPASLVLPLSSILPCDSPVDGRRIFTAQAVLLEEESLHGRMTLLQAARQLVESWRRLARAVGSSSAQDRNAGSHDASLYDQLAAVHAGYRRNEKAVVRVRQARVEASRVLAELDGHMQWIERRRQEDREREQHIWNCRNRYRQEAVKSCARLRANLQEAIAQLDRDSERLHAAVASQQQRLKSLEQEKERRLQARKLQQQQQREPTLSVPIKRSVKLKRPNQSTSPLEPVKRSVLTGLPRLPPLDYPPLETSVATTLHEHSSQTCHVLEEKRVAALQERSARLREQAAREQRARAELDRRRAESVLMKAEDDASLALQQLMETRRQLKQRRALFDRISATAIFKCSHEMSGKTFLVSVYEQKPRGYVLEGVRVSAYDPVTSSTFALVLTLRQFDSYGYGRSREGLRAFCKWLCLLYEKRKRRFRLVWVGSPCPPPLRVREYDHTLVCAHKEGVKWSCRAGYALVAVYVRSDATETLRFVCGSLRPGSESLVEKSVQVRQLFAPEDFELAGTETGGGGVYRVVWRHDRGARRDRQPADGEHQGDRFLRDSTAGWSSCSHVHSGTMIVDGVRVDAHIYDVNSAEYIIDTGYFSESVTAEPPAADTTSTAELFHSHHQRVVLLKRQVNSYPLPLPTESFDDLLSCVTVEPADSDVGMHCGGDNAGGMASNWKAVVSRKWQDKLAKYVRVLRLSRFGCKMAGVFCFVTMYLVQLKTEYRAQLLVEVTPLSPSRGESEGVTKQSLYINLSDYLRCGTAIRRLRLTNDEDTTLHECQCCSKRQLHSEPESYLDPRSIDEAADNTSTCCPGCEATQGSRVGVLRDVLALLLSGDYATWSAEYVDMMSHIVHRERCDSCGAVLPSLLIAIGPELSSHQLELPSALENFYLNCFDYRDLIPSAPVDESAPRYEPSVADMFKQSVGQNRATVLLNADFGVTVAGANGFVYELHALLYPDEHDLPFHTLYIMKSGENCGLNGQSGHYKRDHGVVAAVAAMHKAAVQIGASPVVFMGDTVEACDNGLGFDAFLVAEALLIEATRIVLEPHKSWRKPGGTVGSSSWPVACKLLQDTANLGYKLQRRDVLGFSADTQDTIQAYFSHEIWPHSYDDVRSIFHAVLAFMMHIEHVYRLVGESGGLLATPMAATESRDGRTEWNLHPQTSVLLL